MEQVTTPSRPPRQHQGLPAASDTPDRGVSDIERGMRDMPTPSKSREPPPKPRDPPPKRKRSLPVKRSVPVDVLAELLRVYAL